MTVAVPPLLSWSDNSLERLCSHLMVRYLTESGGAVGPALLRWCPLKDAESQAVNYILNCLANFCSSHVNKQITVAKFILL